MEVQERDVTDFYNLTDNLTTGITGNTTTRTLAATGHVLLGSEHHSGQPRRRPSIWLFAGKVSGAAWTLGQCQQALTNIRATLAGVGITV